MISKKVLAGIASGLVLCTVLSVTVSAAEESTTPPGRRERGMRPEGFRGFDMNAFQQRMVERMKEQLSVTDEEWTIIEPRLSKVMTLNRQMMAGRFGNLGRRAFGPGAQARPGRGTASQDSPLQQAQEKLQETLENENADAAQIKSQLTALREAREKAKQELAKAQQDLREVLTVRQEAQLVMMSVLD